MDKIDSGTITFEDKNLYDLGEDELSDIHRTKMGFVFQQSALLKNLNLLDNIILPSMYNSKRNQKDIIKKARMLMKSTGISDLERRDITQASGGQLQRAGICRALMNNPKIIFADEATGALNSKSAQEIMNIFSDIHKKGTAILLVTHDVKIAAQTEHIMFMQDGNIVDELKFTKVPEQNMQERVRELTQKTCKLGI